jgi:hypothetical protein
LASEQVVLGPLAVAGDPHQVAASAAVPISLARLLGGPQPLGRVQPGLDPLGQLDLLLGVQQGTLPICFR